MIDFEKIKAAAEAEGKARAEAQAVAEREAFENWQAGLYGEYRFNRDSDGNYTDFTVQSQWTAWSARSILGAAA